MQFHLRYLYPIRYWIPMLLVIYAVVLEALFSHASQYHKEAWITWLELTGGVTGLIFLAFLLYYYFIARRLNILLTGVQQLSYGQLETRIDLKEGDEFATLGNALNQMAEQLAANLEQRQIAEKALRRNTEVLQGILANIESIAWSREIGSSDYLYISSAIEPIFGYASTAFQQNPNLWLEVIHLEDRNRVTLAQQTLESTGMKDTEYRIINPDGKIRWLRDRAYLALDDAGKPVRIDGIAVDITEIKEAEKNQAERMKLAALRADIGFLLGQRRPSAAILQECVATIMEQLELAVVRIWAYNDAKAALESLATTNHQCDLINKYNAIALGESIIGRIAQRMQPYQTNTILTDLELTEQAWAKKEGIVAFAGHPLIVEGRMVGVIAVFSCYPLSQPTFEELGAVASGIAQFVERKRVEDALTISEERLRLALEGAQDGVWDWDAKSDKTTFNRQWLHLFGYDHDELRLGRMEWEAWIHPDDRADVLAALNAHIAGQTVHFEAEWRFRTQSGEWKWSLNRGQIVARDPEGRPTRIAGTCKDISERKEAEEMLQNIFRISPDLMVVLGSEPSLHYRKVNPAIEQILGYTVQEALQSDPFNIFHSDDLEIVAQTLNQLLESKEINSFEARARCKDGSYRWISWQAIIGGDDGLIYAVGRDITAAKRLSIIMEQTQAAAHVGGWEVDFVTQQVYWTAETYCLHETSPAEFLPTLENVFTFYMPESLAAIMELMKRGTEVPEWDLELEMVTAKGRQRWIHAVGRMQFEDGRPVKLYGSLQDITQRKATEVALRQSEARNSAILSVIPDHVILCDRDGLQLDMHFGEHSLDGSLAVILSNKTDLSEATAQHFPHQPTYPSDKHSGHDPSYLAQIASYFQGKRVDQFLPPPYGQQVLDAIQVALQGEQQVLEQAYLAPNSELLHMEVRIVPLETDRVVIMVRDVTERKQMEEERSIRKIAEAVPHLMFVYDLVNERHIYVNGQVSHDLGYTPEQFLVLGPAFIETILHEEDYRRFPELRERWINARDGQVFEEEYRMRHKDGEWRWFLGRDTVFTRTPDGEVHQIIGTAQDITAMKHAQQQLLATLKEKDALLKEVHHRVKNNLQIISSLLNLQVAQIKEPMVLDIFNETKHRVRSMALLHETLYHTENLAQIDFHYYVDTLCHYLLRSFGVNSERIRLSIEIGNVQLDMERAIPCGLIINELVSNALKYAFPDERHGNIWVRMAESKRGSFQLCVRDDGIGLPPDLDASRSDSLGLRLVHDLTIQLRGKLAIKSDEGTTFTIAF